MKYVLMYTNRRILTPQYPSGERRSTRPSTAGSTSTAMSWPTAAPNCRAQRQRRPSNTGRMVANRWSWTARSPRRRRTSEDSASSKFPTWMPRSPLSGSGRPAISRRCGGDPADRGPQRRYVNAAVDSSHGQSSPEDAALARIVRREVGLIVAQLQRRLGNFDIAEEAVQAIVALRTWRRDGYRPTLAAGCLWRLGAEPSTCCGSAPARCLWPMGGTPIPQQRRGLGIVRATSACQCCSVAAIRR